MQPKPPTSSNTATRGLLATATAVIAMLAMFGILSGTAAAQTGPNDHVVAPYGNNNGPGTKAKPWKTLTHAMGQLQPGETLWVRKGTYVNQLNYIETRGTATKPIKVRNYPGERPNIIGSSRAANGGDGVDGWTANGDRVWGAIHLVYPAAYLEFRGFNIRGWGRTENMAGVQTWRTHHVTIAGNEIHLFGGGGVNAVSSEHIRVLNNNVHHNAFYSPRATSGISLYKAEELGGPQRYYTNEIRNNYVWANENKEPNPEDLFTDGNCIVVDRFNEVDAYIEARENNQHYDQDDRFNEPDYYKGRTAITNNVCAGNGGRGIHVFRTDNVDVLHNTAWHNAFTPGLTGEGELSTFVADNVRFINNLAEPIPGKRAVLPWVSSNLIFKNNVYVLPGGTVFWQISDGPGDTVVPSAQFQRPVANKTANFRIKASSPVIGEGRATNIYWDKAFNKRAGTVEPGAFDFRN